MTQLIRQTSLAIAALVILAIPAAGQSEIDMTIVSRGASKIPIHVEEFLYENAPIVRLAGGETLEDILVSDLNHSDFFRVSIGPNPRSGRSGRSSLPPSDVRAIASASVRSSWGRTVVAGELRDAETGNRIFSKNYPLTESNERWAIHAFSDDIVLYLTGERGVAETRIAFIRDYGDTREIHVIDYDGVGERVITNFGTIVISPDWAPSADRIGFTSFASGQASIVGMDLEDGKTWRISPAGAMSSSSRWSPDGRHVVFARSVDGNSEIFLAEASGGNMVRLTYQRGIDTSPCFSPDGRQIAFTSDRTGRPQIYVMDRGGGNAQRISYVGKQNDSADWSPHGDRIVFISLIDGHYEICTMWPDGSNQRQLTKNEGMHENPRWAPDGRHIVYSKLHRGQRRIHIMAYNGAGKRVLTSGKGAQYNPAWSPAMRSESMIATGAGE